MMLDRPDETSPRRVSDSVIHKLAAITMEAKRGNVEAIVIIAVGPDGQPHPHFAGEVDLMPSVNLGIDMAKQVILNRIVGAPDAVRMNSGIVLPGRG
jgi:hypothetical protein